MEFQFGAAGGELEFRAAGRGKRRLAGRFPYNSTAVLSDGGSRGRPRKERFASRAFNFRIADPKAEIHLLAGHDYNRPIASKLDGSLVLRDTDEALEFTATIAPELEDTPFFQDLLGLLMARLVRGLSPGFRLPPERAVARKLAERIEEEGIDPDRDMHGAIVRTILAALLFELSLVTAPAYQESEAELRAGLILPPPRPALVHRRWRA